MYLERSVWGGEAVSIEERITNGEEEYLGMSGVPIEVSSTFK